MKKKAKSYVPVAKIKNNLRRLHMHCKYRQKAKTRAKIDVATFKCETEGCPTAYYEGTSEKRYLELREAYKTKGIDVQKGKIELDHILAVVEPKVGYADWNTYIERLWVNDEGYQAICRECHAEKTAKEAGERKEAGTLRRK